LQKKKTAHAEMGLGGCRSQQHISQAALVSESIEGDSTSSTNVLNVGAGGSCL
jgi:hypothetical protein